MVSGFINSKFVNFIMPCNGTCHRYKAAKPPIPQSRYGMGQKRCTHCDIFTEWEELRYPCCSGTLRTKPKSTDIRQ